jgi:hypothetical protein
MTDNDIFRPNDSVRLTTGPIADPSKPDLKTAGQRVRLWSWLFLAALFLAAVVAFLPPDVFVARPKLAWVVIPLLPAVFGVGWILAIGHLGGALATLATENGDSETSAPAEADPTACPACGFALSGGEAACPDCGISFGD